MSCRVEQWGVPALVLLTSCYQEPEPCYGAAPYYYGPYPPPPPAPAPQPARLNVKVTTYETQSPYASSPLYRADQPSGALASPCDEGCGGSRCDVTTNRCIHPCRSNADCQLGYSCLPVGPSQATLCVWP